MLDCVLQVTASEHRKAAVSCFCLTVLESLLATIEYILATFTAFEFMGLSFDKPLTIGIHSENSKLIFRCEKSRVSRVGCKIEIFSTFF